ncbi:MAG: PqqD family protein [Candidatus Electronema sp. VV]
MLKLKRKTDFVLQDICGEKMLVPIGSQVMDMNGLITLNETAAYVWELLAEDRSLDELAAAVAEQFDVAPERARADVQVFIDEITRMGLVEQ